MLFVGLVGVAILFPGRFIGSQNSRSSYITSKPCISPFPGFILVIGNSAQWLGLCHLVSKNR